MIEVGPDQVDVLIKSVRGVGHTLLVTVTGRPSKKALLELLAVFSRYRADLKQFQQFGHALESFLQVYTGWRQCIYGKGNHSARGN